MTFNDLEIPGPDTMLQTWHNKRYVISGDPYDEETIRALREDQNVFQVYDRLNQSVSCKIWTTKTFDEFVKWFLHNEASKVPFFISHKFITHEGRTCNLGEANPGSKPSERYNDTF
jgi:hypothetical protein